MLQTKRLILKSLESADRDVMIDLLINGVIKETYMLPDFQSQDEAVKLFERMRELSVSKTRYVRGIYRDNILIGMVNDVGIEGNKIELGYMLAPAYHNQGYATEMLRAVIDEMFERGFEEVLAGAFETNVASRRVMEKSGMTLMEQEEEIEYRGNVHRCVYYSAKKENFER